MDAALLRAHQLGQAVEADFARGAIGTTPMKWGDQQALVLPDLQGGASPPQVFVNIGPFDEPQAIRIDADAAPLIASASLPPPRYEYTVTYSVGGAAFARTLNTLPRLVTCTSLQVSARRLGESSAHIRDAGPLRIFATPSKPSLPVVIATQVVNWANGVATAVLQPPPRDATHVQLIPSTAVSATIWLLLQVAPSSANIRVPFFGASNGTQVPGLLPPWAFPTEVGALANWQAERSATAGAQDCVVLWLRA